MDAVELAGHIAACRNARDVVRQMHIAHYVYHLDRDQVACVAAASATAWGAVVFDEIVWVPAAFDSLQNNEAFRGTARRSLVRWAYRWCAAHTELLAWTRQDAHGWERMLAIVELLVRHGAASAAETLARQYVFPPLTAASTSRTWMTDAECQRLWEVACTLQSDVLGSRMWHLISDPDAVARATKDSRAPLGFWRQALSPGSRALIELAATRPDVLGDSQCIMAMARRMAQFDALGWWGIPLPLRIRNLVVEVRCQSVHWERPDRRDTVVRWLREVGEEYEAIVDALRESLCLSPSPELRMLGLLF